MTNILRSTATGYIRIEDAAGNVYALPASLKDEFEKMDQEIVDTRGGFDLSRHSDLCDLWFERFGRYEV